MDRYGIPTCALQQGSYHRLSRNCSHSRQGTANAFDALGFLVNDPCLQQWNPGDDGTKVLTQATQLPCLYKFPHPFRTPPLLHVSSPSPLPVFLRTDAESSWLHPWSVHVKLTWLQGRRHSPATPLSSEIPALFLFLLRTCRLAFCPVTLPASLSYGSSNPHPLVVDLHGKHRQAGSALIYFMELLSRSSAP